MFYTYIAYFLIRNKIYLFSCQNNKYEDNTKISDTRQAISAKNY